MRAPPLLLLLAFTASAAFSCGDDDDEEPEGGGACSNTCEYAYDGQCDDGGEGADYSLCELGSDCGDCGSRGTVSSDPGTGGCSDSCSYAFDGECDDGGAGAAYDVCAYGSDCGDCGPRGDVGSGGGDGDGDGDYDPGCTGPETFTGSPGPCGGVGGSGPPMPQAAQCGDFGGTILSAHCNPDTCMWEIVDCGPPGPPNCAGCAMGGICSFTQYC